MSQKKTLVITTSIVVVAAIGFFAIQNTTPTDETVTGAIGTVDKYRSEQIQESDVVLEGHDPAVMELFEAPSSALEGIAVRLD